MDVYENHLKYYMPRDAVLSEAGRRVGELLDAWLGLHHLDQATLKRADWTNDHHICLRLSSGEIGGLSTFDFNDLSTLVFLAHDRCIRVDVKPCNPQFINLIFHPRHGREGGMSQRHPTLEDAVATWRVMHPAPPEPPKAQATESEAAHA